MSPTNLTFMFAQLASLIQQVQSAVASCPTTPSTPAGRPGPTAIGPAPVPPSTPAVAYAIGIYANASPVPAALADPTLAGSCAAIGARLVVFADNDPWILSQPAWLSVIRASQLPTLFLLKADGTELTAQPLPSTAALVLAAIAAADHL